MARGDLTLFDVLGDDILNGVHDFDTGGGTFKVGLIDNTTAPTAADATPAWGDYSANEVSGTNYTAGGATIANTVVNDETGQVWEFDGDDVTWSYHASGFTDAYWAIIYNDSAGSDQAIGFVDLDGPVSLQDGDVTISWASTGIFRLTVS